MGEKRKRGKSHRGNESSLVKLKRRKKKSHRSKRKTKEREIRKIEKKSVHNARDAAPPGQNARRKGGRGDAKGDRIFKKMEDDKRRPKGVKDVEMREHRRKGVWGENGSVLWENTEKKKIKHRVVLRQEGKQEIKREFWGESGTQKKVGCLWRQTG